MNIKGLASALKKRVVGATSDVLSAPTRAYYGVKSAIADQKYKSIVGQRNFRNRKDNTNYYKGNDYWVNHKN